eukprot:m.341986 g.341986  ORF g.341986 m.341986 type:complete len:1271 (-) comp20747_c0_seq1:17-3829(-)
MTEYQLLQGTFTKRGMKNWHNWKQRFFVLVARGKKSNSETGGFLIYKEAGVEKGQVAIKGSDVAEYGITSEKITSTKCPQAATVRGVIKGDSGPNLHFFTDTSGQAEMIVALVNACDLENSESVNRLAKAVEYATRERPLIEQPCLSITGAQHREANHQFHYNKMFRNKPQYKWVGEKKKDKVIICASETHGWDLLPNKHKDSYYGYNLHQAARPEECRGVWYLYKKAKDSFHADPNLALKWNGGSIQPVSMVKLFSALKMKLREKASAITFSAAPEDYNLAALLDRLTWWDYQQQRFYTNEILDILELFSKHDHPDVKKVLARDSLVPLLTILENLETGGSKYTGPEFTDDICSSPTVIVTGNLIISGYYTCMGTHEGRGSYKKPKEDSENHEKYLFYNATDKRWLIGDSVGADSFYAYAYDDVNRPEAIASKWHVCLSQTDGTLDFLENEDLVVRDYNGLLPYKDAIIQRLITIMIEDEVSDAAAEHCHDLIFNILERCNVRIKGPAPAIGEKGSDVDKFIRIFGPDTTVCLVYKMMEAMCTRITVRINDEEDESKSVNAVIPVMKTKAAEEMVLGSQGKPQMLGTMLDFFLAATQPDKNGKIIDKLPCNVLALLRAVRIPLSLRHSNDPRFEPIRKRLIEEVTPRLLDITLEMAGNQNLKNLLDNHVQYFLTNLAFLCELEGAASIVAGKNMAINTMLSLVTRGTATEFDNMTQVASMTKKDAEFQAEAYEEVLYVVSEVCKHSDTSEIVQDGVFRADPIPTLVKVLTVQTTDICQLLAAQTVYRLTLNSHEHRDSAVRSGAIPAMLKILKTGKLPSQLRASFCLSFLLRDREAGQKQFIDEGGALPLIRLLERETSGRLSVGLQRMVVHLTSLKSSARVMVDEKIALVLLRILQNTPDMDIRSQLRIATSLLQLCFMTEFKKTLKSAGVDKGIKDLMEHPGFLPKDETEEKNEDNTPEGVDVFNLNRHREKFFIKNEDEDSDISEDPERLLKERQNLLKQTVQYAAFWLRDEESGKKGKGDHVFLSYHYSEKAAAESIYALLKENNFNVWMDIKDQKSDDYMENLETAVFNAFAIIIAYSEEYEKSAVLRNQGELAFYQGVPIIPVLVQPGFKANGRLKLLTSMRKYHDLSAGPPSNATAPGNVWSAALPGLLEDVKLAKAGKLKNSNDNVQAVETRSSSMTSNVVPTSGAPVLDKSLPQDSDLAQLLWNLKLYDECNQIFASNAIETLEDLEDFDSQELANMGVKWGHAKKILKSLNEKTKKKKK